jgi:DNA-binding CsgD family transcriptional regulator
VVELRFFGGIINEEIADVLATSPATADAARYPDTDAPTKKV